jgi:hypothetical protein
VACVRNEPVTASRHSLDKLHASRTFTERFPQQRDVLSQISFLDEGVRPNSFHQIVFCDDLPTVFDESHEDVEDLRGEWNELTFPQQDALRRY